MPFVGAGPVLAFALPLAACSGEPQADAAAAPELSCSEVRSEHRQAREQLVRRVDEIRAAEAAAGTAGKPAIGRNREIQQLMADIERAEARFAARSRKCVGE
ncbi:MAG TPA: hypothetical protein VD846_01980 [Allosphingosinicella sp.]|nr:hypothetical protein [Allosphingosinicella sp.]